MESTREEVGQRICDVLRRVIIEMTGANDESLTIDFVLSENTTVFKINLLQKYRGRLIGINGKNIMALRDLLTAMSGSRGQRAIIDLVV